MGTDKHETERTWSTRALLACGVIAGPLYVAATLAQALTREGFDITHHRFTLLTTGDLGWVHQTNMVVAGALTMLFAVGVSGTFRTGRSAMWAPWLIALLGAAYTFGGALTADPVPGFPPGTTQATAQITLQAVLQNASRSVSSLLLVASSLAVAMAFAAEGRRGLAWVTGAIIPIAFAGLIGAGLVLGITSGGLAYLMTPWVWVTVTAFTLFGRDATPYGTASSWHTVPNLARTRF